MRLLARIGAIEFLVENIYAVALMQTYDPAGAARRWAAQAVTAHSAEAAASAAKAGLSRLPARSRSSASAKAGRAGVDGVDRALAAALVAGMSNELDAIFGRIIDRLDKHARDHPTAGRA